MGDVVLSIVCVYNITCAVLLLLLLLLILQSRFAIVEALSSPLCLSDSSAGQFWQYRHTLFILKIRLDFVCLPIVCFITEQLVRVT